MKRALYVIRRWADGWDKPHYLSDLAGEQVFLGTTNLAVGWYDPEAAKAMMRWCFEHHRYDSWNRFEVIEVSTLKIIATMEWTQYQKPDYIQ